MSAPHRDPYREERLLPPPSWPIRLVLRLLDPGDREEFLGEMDELHRFRIERDGPAGADRWARREYRRLALRALPLRILRARSRPRWGFFDRLRQDLSFAMRQLRRGPVWSAVVVGTLALGIGATALVFSVAEAVLLEPLPFEGPETLVRVWDSGPAGDEYATSDANYLDYVDRSRSFEALAATPIPFPQVTLFTEEGPERIQGVETTASLWDVLRARATQGRLFTAGEVETASPDVAVLSHAFWRERFAEDPGIVGRTLDIDGRSRTVVGVLAPDFHFLGDPDVWLPFVPRLEFDRGDRRLETYGRLAAGVSIEEAQSEMDVIAAGLATTYPEANGGYGINLVRFEDWLIGPTVSRAVTVLLLGVGLLLLLGCANVANLWIVRATHRAREIGVRAAIGASRRRLVAQLLTEAMTLSTLAAVSGTALTLWALPLVRALGPETLPRIQNATLAPRVLLFTVIVTILVGLLCGLAPAVHAFRDDLHQTFRAATTGRRTRGGARDLLVVGQLALAVVLLASAGVLVASFQRLSTVDPGFTPEQVLTVDVSLPPERYAEFSREVADFYRLAVDRIADIPAVTSAGATAVNPFRGLRLSNTVGRADMVEKSQFHPVQWRAVTRGFFETLEIPVLEGRAIGEVDRDGERVAVVSERLAREMWPGESAVGKELQWIQPGVWSVRVIGVVGDLRDTELQDAPLPTVYLDHRRFPWPWLTLMVRTAGDPAELTEAVRAAIWSIDPTVPIPNLTLLSENIASETAPSRFNAQLTGLLALLALLIAGMGVYAVVSFGVAARTAEIGVRMALGADRAGVVGRVVGDGARLVVAGILAGSLGAIALSGLLRSVLYETAPADPKILAAVALSMLSVGLLASALPAVRASRVDPISALRQE